MARRFSSGVTGDFSLALHDQPKYHQALLQHQLQRYQLHPNALTIHHLRLEYHDNIFVTQLCITGNNCTLQYERMYKRHL